MAKRRLGPPSLLSLCPLSHVFLCTVFFVFLFSRTRRLLRIKFSPPSSSSSSLLSYGDTDRQRQRADPPVAPDEEAEEEEEEKREQCCDFSLSQREICQLIWQLLIETLSSSLSEENAGTFRKKWRGPSLAS